MKNKHNDSLKKYIILFLIFISPAIATHILIQCNLLFELKFHLNKLGFEYFIEIFNIPLKLLWYCILAYGIFIALLKLHSSEKLYRLNYESYKITFLPIIMSDSLVYDNKTKELIFNFINSGKYAARIISLHIRYVMLPKIWTGN